MLESVTEIIVIILIVLSKLIKKILFFNKILYKWNIMNYIHIYINITKNINFFLYNNNNA